MTEDTDGAFGQVAVAPHVELTAMIISSFAFEVAMLNGGMLGPVFEDAEACLSRETGGLCVTTSPQNDHPPVFPVVSESSATSPVCSLEIDETLAPLAAPGTIARSMRKMTVKAMREACLRCRAYVIS